MQNKAMCGRSAQKLVVGFDKRVQKYAYNL